ncbi:MAG: glycosyltransferase family 10, partial [Nanoarchaeota archaeon]|nr:glycosyltransferase family 10 [Nanoarchaeota archaeon]
KELKISFRYFWPKFNEKENFFINLLKEKYKIVLEDKNPQIVFFSLYPGKSISLIRRIYRYVKIKFFNIPSYYTPKIKGPFKKIFFTPENYIPNFKRCDLAFGFEYEKNIKNTKYLRLPLYFFEGIDESLTKKILFKENYVERKFCNFIYGHRVKFRNKFFKELSKYKKIDSPGKCMNNHKLIGKTSLEKIKFLENYKFTIAFENCASSGYTTEKILHPMIAKSIPIYFGNPKIEKDFNKESFLVLKSKSKKHVKELVKEVIDLDLNDEVYLKMLKKPWIKKDSLDKYCNKKKILNKIEMLLEKNG